MSDIRFACPGCGREFEVPANQAGRRGACTHCRVRFTIPGAAPVPPAFRERVGMPASRLPPLPTNLLNDPPTATDGAGSPAGPAPSPAQVIARIILLGLFLALATFCVTFPHRFEQEEYELDRRQSTAPEPPTFAVTWVSGRQEIWSLSRTYGGPVRMRVFRPPTSDRPAPTVLVLGSVDDDLLRQLADRGFLVLSPLEPESSRELPEWLRQLARHEPGFDGLHVVGVDWCCREAWELARDNAMSVRLLLLVDPQSALPGADTVVGVTEIPVHLYVTSKYASRAPAVGRKIGRMVIADVVVRPQGSTDWIADVPLPKGD